MVVGLSYNMGSPRPSSFFKFWVNKWSVSDKVYFNFSKGSVLMHNSAMVLDSLLNFFDKDLFLKSCLQFMKFLSSKFFYFSKFSLMNRSFVSYFEEDFIMFGMNMFFNKFLWNGLKLKLFAMLKLMFLELKSVNKYPVFLNFVFFLLQLSPYLGLKKVYVTKSKFLEKKWYHTYSWQIHYICKMVTVSKRSGLNKDSFVEDLVNVVSGSGSLLKQKKQDYGKFLFKSK